MLPKQECDFCVPAGVRASAVVVFCVVSSRRRRRRCHCRRRCRHLHDCALARLHAEGCTQPVSFGGLAPRRPRPHPREARNSTAIKLTNERTNQPTDQPIHPPTDQPTNQPTNQPTGKPTNLVNYETVRRRTPSSATGTRRSRAWRRHNVGRRHVRGAADCSGSGGVTGCVTGCHILSFGAPNL